MKNPNGYGTVRKLSGNRRKPFQVSVTVAFDETGKQIRKCLGSFATRSEALQCLATYNQTPEEFAKKISFADVYSAWHNDKFYGDYNENTEMNYSKAFKRAERFHDRVFAEVKLAEMQKYIDGLPSHNQASRFVTLVSQMSDYAIDRDYAVKNYAKGLKVKQKQEKQKPRTSFEPEDRERIIALGTPASKIMTVLFYSGVRISELLDLKREDVDLKKKTFFIKEAKTENGVRVVPIHNRVLPIFREYYDKENEYIFCNNHGDHFTYYNWSYNYFTPMMEDLGLKGKYTSHYTRHTFISSAVQSGVDLTALRKIVGHSSLESLTERVYTHLDVAFLIQEINKIP